MSSSGRNTERGAYQQVVEGEIKRRAAMYDNEESRASLTEKVHRRWTFVERRMEERTRAVRHFGNHFSLSVSERLHARHHISMVSVPDMLLSAQGAE